MRRDKGPEPTEADVTTGKDFAGAILMFHAALAERLGLGGTDHKALDLIARHGPVTAGWLAQRTGLTTGAVTGIVDRLERAGYARRVRDAADRRVVRLEAIPERHAEVGKLTAPMRAAMAALQGEFSPEELDAVQRYLRRVGEVMKTETARLRK